MGAGSVICDVGSLENSMRKVSIISICSAVLIGAAVLTAQTASHTVKPKVGFVPDAKTAIKIAVAVWEPIYGEPQIAREKPYLARLDTNGFWIVEGSLPRSWLGSPVKGGVVIAEIAKDDGRILRVSHGK